MIEACLKVTVATFYFYFSNNPSNIMKYYFYFHLYIFLKKLSWLANIRKKCYKENKSLFFDVMKNGQIFPAKVFLFPYDHRFCFSREMGNIGTCREVRLQKPITFSQDSIVKIVLVLAFFKLLKNEESFGKNFFFPFSAKCLDRMSSNICFKNFKDSYLLLYQFLMS